MKKTIIGFLIFASIAFGTTYFAIQNANKVELVQSNETGIDLYGTYDQNDLIINELKETYNGVEIEIPELNGLKNAKIQNKINKDIKNSVYDALKSLTDIRFANFYTRAKSFPPLRKHEKALKDSKPPSFYF